MAGVPLPLWLLHPSFCRWWLQMRVLIPHLAVGRAYGLEGHTNLEVLRSSDKHANMASEGMLPVATCLWHFPIWHCHHTLPPGAGDRAAPSPSDTGAMAGFPASSPMGRKLHPELRISQERVKNASNPRKWPNDGGEGLCYGNAERCPPGLVAPSISLGRSARPCLTLVLAGISLLDASDQNQSPRSHQAGAGRSGTTSPFQEMGK